MSALVRPARPGDAPALVALMAQLGYPGTGLFIERRLAGQLAHPDALLLVAEVQGRPAGFISLHFIPQIALAGDFCRISYLCVDEASRGEGVGAALEQAAVEEARRRGCDRVEVHCHQRRTDAHRFYARQGYEESPKYLIRNLLSI